MSRSVSVASAFQALERRVEGEVRTDKLTRVLYSTDASIYQMEPDGVVLPRHEKDLVEAVKLAAQFQLPIIPRAGGTSLAGQCVGKGIVVDVSKYMNQMVEANPEEQWAWVEPGVIQDELSRMVEAHGLMYGPDTSTSNRAMIGGMIGNNSCGTHSIYYGKTVDHTLEMDVVLSDGSTARFTDLTPEQVEEKKKLANFEGHIYREVTRILEEYKDDIEERFPKIMRRNTGYLLDELVDPNKPFNLSRLICGSEGTLALISKARVNLVQRPKVNGLMAIQFDNLEDSLTATVEAIKHNPSAVELVDEVIIDLASENPSTIPLQFFIEGSPRSILAVEFYGDSREEIEAKMDDLESALREQGWGYTYPRLWGNDINKVWAYRKAGLGVLMAMPGDSKPATFMEDTAVPPEHLPAYVEGFKEIMAKYNTECCYYAHASVGELHLRPILDLKQAEDRKKMVDMSWDIVDLVMKFGGSVSGEHGDGRVRSMFVEKFFGPRLYQAMREVKQAFDPHNLFNPHKIVDPLPMDTDLRVPHKPMDIPTTLSFDNTMGYMRAAEYCNGAGACRKSPLAKGTMCPSYQATLDEKHTTRGRANMLRTTLAQNGIIQGFTDPDLAETMSLCLECKACKSECPSAVDMAKLKYEYLQQRHDIAGTPLSALAFGFIGFLNKVNRAVAPLFNWMVRRTFVKSIMEKLIGFDSRRSIPEIVTPTTMDWYWNHQPHPNAGSNGQRVYFFADPFTNYNEPHVGIAAIRVLEAAGYDVKLSPIEEDGRARISKGLLHSSKKLALSNRQRLLQLVEEDAYLVGVEPSTLLTFRDEYLDFFPKDTELKEAAERCLLIDEFITREAKSGRFQSPFKTHMPKRSYQVHGHCFQKSLVGVQPTLDMLHLVPNVTAENIPSGCCGMAGSFGYDKKKYDVSMSIGELVLFPAVRGRGMNEVLAVGTSCRHQIHDGVGGYQAQHPIEVLADALRPE
ncbi:MAG: FAD-binding oxidoreductase [Deltaproteobacteria bacterium]|nr:MAG: FAD-binding oxidoreductase [Deltaproteobacteria bacterium]